MMKLNCLLILGVCCLFGDSVGQLEQDGQCNPEIELSTDFDYEKFEGTWFEIQRTGSAAQNAECAAFEFIAGENSYNVRHTGVNKNFQEDSTGTASLKDVAKMTLDIDLFDGHQLATSSDGKLKMGGEAKDFWVLSTDNNNFALIYSCENIDSNRRKIDLWVLGRARTYPNAMIPLHLDNTLNNLFNVSLNSLNTVDHNDNTCYVLPVIDPGYDIILPGQCDPSITVVQNFNVPAFMGTWYQIYDYYTENSNGTCNTAQYTLGTSAVDVLNSQVIDQTLYTITGTASVASNDSSAILSVILNINGVQVPQDLWVLATDYTNYAISYTCVNLPDDRKRIYSWILSRDRELNQEAQERVNEVVNSNIDLNYAYYQLTDQTEAGCFNFPEPNDLPVIFPGTCDMTIPAMANFNPNRYTGRWHTIEMYPTEFQDGTCSNAYYQLVDGVVDVLNSQVINETLDTIRATAVLASDDGSAKLRVTFPVAGTNLTVTTDYWVLDTDYDDYALVYSCNNLPGRTRRVGCWKLSRRKTLSNNANNIINEIMSPINVLAPQYFKTVDQSLAACFYFPMPQPGVAVVFPGQCDTNIDVMPNFELSRFEGTWYETAAYPKDEEGGQCISHVYSAVSGSQSQLSLVSTSIVDQFLTTTNSEIISTDSSGKLTIRLLSDNNIIEIPFWILNTDYTDYAYAYACVNRDSDYRAVYSWKLSRTKTLSTAGSNAINTAMANIRVLDEKYFEIIQHTEEACFTLPVLGPTEPVILDGQCDPNIPVISNFDASKYLGRWRLVASYYTDRQTGTCNEATYSLENDGSVTVINTVVRDQGLASITGSATAAADGSGKLSVTFPSSNTASDYWILDTDYVSYALVYSCENMPDNRRRVWSWKLSRTNTLTPDATSTINTIVKSINVLNDRYYQSVDRSDDACFYYPQPDDNTAVVFRGQCDMNIPVVANFDVEKYLNTWHDIESYPVPFQFGTCPNAFYSLGDGVVDVFNTQVINQSLDSINGTAELAEDANGSGKLVVKFPRELSTTDYWVLDTDYTSYAFVYSCKNLDDETRFVSSWKLSRTKSLTASATASINSIMNNINVLDQRYFVNRDQTPEGCFYYPEPEPGVPVVFPGQCDDTINTYSNFDMTQFEGTWYETQAYPKDDQPGQCISHTYTVASATQLNLVSTNINNQELSTTNSIVTGTDGKLNIALVSNGQTINIPFWIIDTDYRDYALAYSCVNRPDDRRAVYSWKLSRTKTLTTAGSNAINTAMTNIDVIDERYFETIQQTEEACFYLPFLGPNDPVTFPGQCEPNIQAKQNFNLTAYLGRWRLIESYYTTRQTGTCNEATYTAADDGTVEVYNTVVRNQELASINGSATLASIDGSGKLSVTFPSSDTASEYWILDTDYTSYALVYSCENMVNNQKRVWSWKLSRTNTLTPDATSAINTIVNSINVLNDRYYQSVDRSDDACFYYPQLDDNTAVVFRGQCDMNIPVVANFDVAKYLDTWHDIESYPVPFQFGTCPNALYSLGDGVVDVFNTQVINQSLDTINGTAELAEDANGSGKLVVKFPRELSETDYWVLDTDYTSYAFVYSCQNLDDETRFVSSWKLSRTKSLTASATASINSIMNNINVLDQRYFVNRDQTPEGCFYYPEPEPGVPVVFPGQCDDTINTYSNFDMTQFEGTWYETQAYPKDDQPGQCISHTYTVASATQLNLVSTNINNQELSTTNSIVTGTDGKLNIALVSNGQTINIPFWIIDTDYRDYALAYSCVNRPNDRRAVYSWKLSRTKTLTTAGSNAINTAMTNIDVIDERYFETIQQTEEACFYLPVLGPNDPVTFPGQCDPNIQAKQNFNLTAYLGRWRLIESYYTTRQTGTCNEATYTAADDGTVEVYNTVVRNQELASINGSATLASIDGSGKLSVTFPSSDTASDYWILDTDYTSYALVYSCENIVNNQKRVWSWKLSRTNTLTPDATSAINTIVNNINVLNDRYYQSVDRSDNACFYYPQPDDNTAVVFRGQCDMNIPVVANFDVAKYLNTWHDIESYPVPFQFGTCPNALYSLGDGVVDVFNTQVINQSLDTINGTAELAEDANGSGKLVVKFPRELSETDYWVLDTDYTSYAFVYSCQNLDDETRFVSSWKLSRTKSLTASATASINSIMNNINVLDQRYFVNRDQTPEGCFYYPEPEPGVPVVFPGQCDDTINTYSNFDMTQFGGTWYETQAYPKDDQPGQCISHTYTVASATQLNLVSTNINNQVLSTTNSIVTGTDGKLNIALVSNGQTINIPFWIIDTDYRDYALAYSCVNRPNDRRAVYSWKLSRTKTLTTAGSNAINTAMTNIDVIDERYFETIQQTEEACFYLPVLGPNDPVTFPGQCDPNIQAKQNFNLTAYLGRWRLMESYYTARQTGTCNEATYTAADDGTVEVYNTVVRNQELASINGSATLASIDGSGKLSVTFPSSDTASDYWILDTDYTSYAIVYSCENIVNNRRRVWSWKLSRTNTLTADATSAINTIVNNINVLNDRYYQSVDRSDDACFYYPQPDDNTAVVFRGQCDMNIPVVANFDVAKYLDTWHDIESYPVPFQFGTCPNALYSLGDGVVDVFNTQVINQSLDTINGTAELAEDANGSGKLVVKFPRELSETDYWVLDTDYTSYAFVYSCQNLDDETRFVASWKLSRTKSLTASATASINSIMNNINVLDQRYFVNRDQTPEGCFYYPEPEPDVPVVFPGQCDDTINTYSNFDMTQFEGTWYETQAYPKDDQPGQCISHTYTVAGATQLNLVSTNINNQVISTTNSIVTGTDGKLNIALVSNGQTINIPFWIIDTDYRDYALAYSCVNRPDDRRAVYSWKLSRTKTLSTAGSNAINTAMANIDVIDERYFETIQQTDEACFYLPVLGPNDPVTFPGQCDPNIQAKQNFNVNAYLGRWRLIESYYTARQTGTCNEATYTAADDGTVEVYNTVVRNQELASINGSATLASIDGSGKLSVTFPSSETASDYWILDTDYTSYALVYSCENISSDRRRVWSWKLSRTNTLTPDATSAINTIVNNINVLNDRYYQSVDRSDDACFYYPQPDDNTPVVFRGQCDMNIPALPNFEAGRYLGTWYDVQSYPAPFQTGTCGKAFYSTNEDGSVLVENTQVVNQLLETWIGSAVLASDDQTAKLNVTFNVNGVDVTTDYWVLDTDYDSYALVYSCQNIDDETRGVFSWKLSRTPTLTPTAITNINAITSGINVLDQRYYIENSHTEDDCFFYPDNNGGDVILPGQCVSDELVLAVTNFNAELYAGTWHEISRFPSGAQNAECYFTNYALSGSNGFTVVRNHVSEERLMTVASQATFRADGRGVISANIDGAEFNVYILGVDYNDYVLGYACRNLDDERKQIYSWKLSRNRAGLSADANNAINELVTQNIDLWGGYYRLTGQDNDACFYYPVFDVLPSTIDLPGTCPTNIRGVPNFNAVAYLGRWFETARYPVNNQLGKCNRAEYSVSAITDRVVVYNTQVDDLTLLTQSGYASVASTDGSGQLNVEFIVNGVSRTANYYILATDYQSYSLVYSCTNLDNGYRRVGSWKLSRERTQSQAPNMDTVIQNTQGLLEDYYMSTSQSDDDCFYIPSLNINQTLAFRGQCESISGIEGFDVQRYLGWWHEIERYPIDSLAGECRSSEYLQDGNTYRVVDTRVVSNEGTTTSGTVVASNNGRLLRTMPDGTVSDIWVLDTDYETYALLYSCENIDDEYRRVWSAKHSKSRSLTADAQSAMAPFIANNRVLYENLYVPVVQTDADCFHYPSLTTGEVIIPGQCDESIGVVQDFSVADFAGTWYHTERYDSVDEGSSCVGSRFIVNDATGSIQVINFEVQNEELQSVVGTATVESNARITLTFPVAGSEDEGESISTSVSVLATDYENYALVYNCANVNSFQRRVRAWKLSRERAMPSAGTTAINALIQQRQELHQPFFYRIDQQEGCLEPSSAFLIKHSIIVLLVCAMLQRLL